MIGRSSVKITYVLSLVFNLISNSCFLGGELILENSYDIIDGKVDIALSDEMLVTGLFVKRENDSLVTVDQFSFNYTFDSEEIIYTDYPEDPVTRTVSVVVILSCLYF